MRTVLLSILGLLLACAHAPPTPAAQTTPPAPPPSTPEAKCPPRFEPIPGNACLALPPNPSAQTPLVLFFHGMYPVDSPEQEFASEERLAAAAQQAGFAVLAPRGAVGICDWSPHLARFACWPILPKQRAKVGQVLERLAPAFQETSRRLHAEELRPWVAGFSVGGYMAVLVASETKLPMRGLAVLHGGAAGELQLSADRAVPTLLLAAEQDSGQRPEMEQLDKLMTEKGWAHTFQLHPGVHEIADDDLRALFPFFEKAAAGVTASPQP